ncbi:MAG TPA: LysR family transcriptional regulator [Gammaproteobacteria bacterium]|nr:LysR family transcriptional regulator [Gammaproteobacteria bacterium]
MFKTDLQSLKSLMIFKTLVENGTATRTAKVLGITQSGVSRSLAQLEQNLGMRLFIRQKNRLLATPETKELYDEILRLVNNLDELEHSVMALREFGASRIGIAVIPGLGFGFIPALIGRLRGVNPRLAIYLDIMSSHDVVHAVEAGAFDIGFVTLPITSSQLVVEQLIETEAVCLLPKGHPLELADSVRLEQLAGQHLVVPNQPNIAADQLLRLIASHGIRIAGKTEANIGSICSLVGNGVGLSVVNPITALDLAHKGMVTKPFVPVIHYAFGMVYQEKWRDNNTVKQIRHNLPPISEYLLPA